MESYLERFHKYKSGFLKYRAGKKVTTKMKEALKNKSSAGKEEISAEKRLGVTKAQQAQLAKKLRKEQEILQNDILEEGAHFNFPKMHIIMHFGSQIPQYSSLPQISTEVGEALYKALKAAYRRTNHVDTMSQILKMHARDHAFTMKELNLKALSKHMDIGTTSDLIPAPISSNLQPKNEHNPSFVKLQNPQRIKAIMWNNLP